MKEYIVKNHEPSLLPDGFDFELAWSDEFDGDELDTSKWDFRMSMMATPWPAWTDKGVKVEGGNCVFELMLDEQGNPVSSQLQTGYNFMDAPIPANHKLKDGKRCWNIGALKENKFTHLYGYYECRCKLQEKPGWWSAFWIQSPIIGASLDPALTGAEVDIMESFEPGKIDGHNVFTGGYGVNNKRLQVGGNKTLDTSVYHRFGVLWNEEGYTFYIDGEEDGHISENVSKTPQFILLTTEVLGYRRASGVPDIVGFDAAGNKTVAMDSVGDKFYVDYVRVFDVIKNNNS